MFEDTVWIHITTHRVGFSLCLHYGVSGHGARRAGHDIPEHSGRRFGWWGISFCVPGSGSPVLLLVSRCLTLAAVVALDAFCEALAPLEYRLESSSSPRITIVLAVRSDAVPVVVVVSRPEPLRSWTRKTSCRGASCFGYITHRTSPNTQRVHTLWPQRNTNWHYTPR